MHQIQKKKKHFVDVFNKCPLEMGYLRRRGMYGETLQAYYLPVPLGILCFCHVGRLTAVASAIHLYSLCSLFPPSFVMVTRMNLLISSHVHVNSCQILCLCN